METISLKLDKGLLNSMKQEMQMQHYATKTEYIREAIREKLKLDQMDRELHWEFIDQKTGRKRVITREMYKEAGEKAFLDIEKKVKRLGKL